MFTSLTKDSPETVTVCFEGQDMEVRKGLSIAAALLEAGIRHFRNTPVNDSARAPFCMMGICFDCVLIVDGMPNQQSCMLEVREGMQLERQSGLAAPIIESNMRLESNDE